MSKRNNQAGQATIEVILLAASLLMMLWLPINGESVIDVLWRWLSSWLLYYRSVWQFLLLNPLLSA